MRNILLIAVGALILMELSKRNRGATPPPSTTPTVQKDGMEILPQYEKARVAGFFSSQRPGARPELPFQVRWGSGNRFLDTTKKAQLAI